MIKVCPNGNFFDGNKRFVLMGSRAYVLHAHVSQKRMRFVLMGTFYSWLLFV